MPAPASLSSLFLGRANLLYTRQAGPGLGVLYASTKILQRCGPGAAPGAGWFSQLRKGEGDRNYELCE